MYSSTHSVNFLDYNTSYNTSFHIPIIYFLLLYFSGLMGLPTVIDTTRLLDMAILLDNFYLVVVSL